MNLDASHPCYTCGAPPDEGEQHREWEPIRLEDGRTDWRLREWVSYSYPCQHWNDDRYPANQPEALERWRSGQPK